MWISFIHDCMRLLIITSKSLMIFCSAKIKFLGLVFLMFMFRAGKSATLHAASASSFSHFWYWSSRRRSFSPASRSFFSSSFRYQNAVNRNLTNPLIDIAQTRLEAIQYVALDNLYNDVILVARQSALKECILAITALVQWQKHLHDNTTSTCPRSPRLAALPRHQDLKLRRDWRLLGLCNSLWRKYWACDKAVPIWGFSPSPRCLDQ